ncbi:histone-lysine N-methyltransferase, H3 lysine-9 specific SUVH6 [Cocos nucifera]|nr:histone-lysine N-methyltransferase, H3 lysine-9 specific SUVH6 [Cocos nucifera]
MLEVSAPAVPVKYKQRKVSAIRQWPKGCGPLAAGANMKPIKEPPASVELDPNGVSNSNKRPRPDDAVELPAVGEEAASLERVDGVGSSMILRQEVAELTSLAETLKPNDMNSLKCLEHLGAETKKEEIGAKIFPEPVGIVHSRTYPPPKRRMISVVRDFPVGCGRNAPLMSKEESLHIVATGPCKNKIVDEKRKCLANQQLVMEDPAKVVSADEVIDRLDKRNGKKKTQEGDQAQATPAKGNILDGEKQHVLKQPLAVKVPNMDAYTDEAVDGTVKRNDMKKIQQSNQETRSEAHGKPASASSKRKSLDGVKMPAVNPSLAVKGLDKVVPTKKVDNELRNHDYKLTQETFKETSDKFQAKTALKSFMKEDILKEHHERKKFSESAYERKSEGGSLKLVNENLQIAETQKRKPSGLVERSQFGEDRKSVGKAIDKLSAKLQKDNKNIERKFPEKQENEDHGTSAQGQEYEALEARGNRLIVQCLLAAQNCPWRHGRKSHASLSVTPRSKVKKEEKMLSKKSALKGPKDKEDLVPLSEENEKALTIYRKPNEFSVTITPVIPSNWSNNNAGSEDITARHKVKKALRLFQLVCRKLLQNEESKSKQIGKIKRVDLMAAGILKENKEWVNAGEPILGNVPGVEVGDEFHYRVELSIVGIHRPFQGGIDSMKLNGKPVATSIVASGGYPDDTDSSDADVLIYSGSGGNPGGGDKQAGDQKLERGNLALKNCIDSMTPVRVIYGYKESKGSDFYDARSKIISTFTYDGLYFVERYWQERGSHGFLVFKFQLRRMPNQPVVGLQEVKRSMKSKVREGLCLRDVSDGKEKIPICAINTIDDEQPPPFKYITKTIYPSWYVKTPPKGCACTDGCSDSNKCACAVKNGGEIPFNFNGAIVQAKPLVYECGPSCRCPPLCHNRVSQHGINIQLEIFKTGSRGWGVRSLNSIPSGSFICEYIGEMLQDTEAEQRNNDEYLFDIGHNYDDQSLWEGLPTLIPGLQSSSNCETVEDVGFTIDAAEYGNVGRFINHSCSPNLYAQNVLYDHDDKRMPHIMFFAADNIPPLQELTYHYNYTIDQVRDSEGNIKRKDCYCGVADLSL